MGIQLLPLELFHSKVRQFERIGNVSLSFLFCFQLLFLLTFLLDFSHFPQLLLEHNLKSVLIVFEALVIVGRSETKIAVLEGASYEHLKLIPVGLDLSPTSFNLFQNLSLFMMNEIIHDICLFTAQGGNNSLRGNAVVAAIYIFLSSGFLLPL